MTSDGAHRDQRVTKGRVARFTSDRGVAAVEAAILIPFFLVPIILGSLELGRVLWIRSQLMEAAREGGYFAQTAPERVQCAGDNDISGKALAALRQGSNPVSVQLAAGQPVVKNVSTNTVITGCNDGDATSIPSGTRILVTVTGTVAPYSLLGFIPVSGYQLSGSQEVRVL